MLRRKSGMGIPWGKVSSFVTLFLFCFVATSLHTATAQDYGDPAPGAGTPPVVPAKEIESCNGIFLSYVFQGREKEYPLVKNVSAQAWSFEALATVMNTGTDELKSWQIFIGFQHNELLVSADGAVVVDGDGFPIRVGNNGTTLAGYPMTDLKTAIDTANDMTQIQAQIHLKGTQFGLSDKATPMPKTIKLVNDGYICPGVVTKGTYMHVCCKKDPKFKVKKITTKFFPRRYGDLTFTYDVLKAYENRYLAQVTIDNNHPLGRLDQWNLTWEWMRNEFIYTMKGAYTHQMDPSECIYGPQGKYYRDFDFSNVMNCQKKPVIGDLPSEKENDDKVGRLPYCCKNGTLLPKTMNETKARALFQLEVFKLPPDLNRTALNPPQNWNIVGRLSPNYKCGPPLRVDPSVFPDPNGLAATSSAVASWEVSCNITKPKPKEAKCCVSYTAYYSPVAIPCNTCACGCEEDTKCNANAPPLFLPPEALLVPFVNRTAKAQAFAKIKKYNVPRKLPCPDNCGVSVNWHVDSDHLNGWTARITLFNWEDNPFVDWYSAIQFKREYGGFQKAYSMNGTRLGVNGTVFLHGLPGLNYLVGEVNGTRPEDPRVPGKQQTVISFTKKDMIDFDVSVDGFPKKLFFNGEECALPKEVPRKSAGNRSMVSLIPAVFLGIMTFLLCLNN